MQINIRIHIRIRIHILIKELKNVLYNFFYVSQLFQRSKVSSSQLFRVCISKGGAKRREKIYKRNKGK